MRAARSPCTSTSRGSIDRDIEARPRRAASVWRCSHHRAPPQGRGSRLPSARANSKSAAACSTAHHPPTVDTNRGLGRVATDRSETPRNGRDPCGVRRSGRPLSGTSLEARAPALDLRVGGRYRVGEQRCRPVGRPGTSLRSCVRLFELGPLTPPRPNGLGLGLQRGSPARSLADVDVTLSPTRELVLAGSRTRTTVSDVPYALGPSCVSATPPGSSGPYHPALWRVGAWRIM